MRENMGRFRGRTFVSDEWEQQWYYGYLYVDSWKGIPLYEIYMPQTDERHIQPEWYCVDPETVGECTGLRDKNGELVFEGDIFTPGIPFSSTDIGIVRFGKYDRSQMTSPKFGGHLGFYAELYEEDGHPMMASHDIFAYFPAGEVIGNIHDNPELIGGDGK